MSTTIRQRLAARQRRSIRKLETELARYVAEGNEYYTQWIQADIVAAKSLARLVHRDA